MSSSYLAGRLIKQLNSKLEPGEHAGDIHMRKTIIGTDFLLEMKPGRSIGEKLYFIWENYRLKGYLYSTTKESLKRRSAVLKRCIPLKDDAYGLGLWLEHSRHFELNSDNKK